VSEIAARAEQLRSDTVDRVPGRVADLIEIRIEQLLDVGARTLPDDLTDAERVVIDVTEQFIVDVHGITDDDFAALGRHYTNEEQVAIMFHLALVDGFTKLRKVTS
jgi:alkylhydroperoxidase family enzyme